jgi:hypothetical protein
VRHRRPRHIETDPAHGLAEQVTVFGLVDASRLAPTISTPNASNTPSRTRSNAQFSAVWPPMVGSSASGRSFSMIFATVRQVIGST